MDTSTHNFAALFAQLGLPNDTASIEQFLAKHFLPDNVTIEHAPFWSESQAEFISDALSEDSDWAEIVDELADLLSKKTARTSKQNK